MSSELSKDHKQGIRNAVQTVIEEMLHYPDRRIMHQMLGAFYEGEEYDETKIDDEIDFLLSLLTKDSVEFSITFPTQKVEK